MADVFIESGRRRGRILENEPRFTERLNRGDRVFTKLNNVWFEVTIDGLGIHYTALLKKPDTVQV